MGEFFKIYPEQLRGLLYCLYIAIKTENIRHRVHGLTFIDKLYLDAPGQLAIQLILLSFCESGFRTESEVPTSVNVQHNSLAPTN